MRLILTLLLLLLPQIAHSAPIQLWNFEENATQLNICPQNISSGTFSIQSSVVNSGTFAFRSNPAGGAGGIIFLPGINLSSGTTNTSHLGNDYWMRGYFRANSLPASGSDSIAFFTDSGTALKAQLRINSAGNILVTDSTQTVVLTSSATLVANQWYLIRFRGGTGAAAPYELTINGLSQGSGTMPQLAFTTGYLALGRSTALAPSGNAVDFFWDDILIDNAAFPPAGSGAILLPNAAGSINEWTAGTGASDFSVINTLPFSVASYVKKSLTASQSIMVNIQDTATKGIPAGSTINAVKVIGAGYNENFATIDAALGMRLNCASVNSTANQTTARSNDTFCNALVLNTCAGTGSAFTTENLDSVQIGVLDSSVTNLGVRNYGSYLYVDYGAPSQGRGALTLMGVGK